MKGVEIMKKAKSGFRFTIAIIIVSLMFIFICSVFLFNVIRDLGERTDDIVYSNTYQKTSYVNHIVNSNMMMVVNMASCLTEYESYSDEDLKNTLKTFSQNAKFLTVFLARPDGSALSWRLDEVNVSHRSYFVKALSGERNVSGQLFSNVDKMLVNVYAAPIYDLRRNVIGVLAATYDALELEDDLNMSFSSKDEPSPGYIIEGNGDVIMTGAPYSEHTSLIGENQNLFESPLYEGITEEDKKLLKTDFENDECNNIIRTTAPNGNVYVAYYTKLDIPGNLHYLLVFPEGIIYDSLYSYVNKIIILFGLFFVVIIMVVLAYLIIAKSSMKAMQLANTRISKLAYEDPVTGFGTWNKFNIDARKILDHSSENEQFAFISFDIDKFKAINDMYGHEEGNRILKVIASTVNRNLREGEVFSRVSSDNYYILVRYTSDEEALERATSFIEAVEYEITQFVPVLSFGIYRIHDKTKAIRKMGDLADIAKRTVKYGEASSIAFYDDSMMQALREEKHIENEMQSALDRHEFAVYYQPKVALQGKPYVMGAEALVRWIKPDGIISPAKFIPLFERNRFIIKLDFYMIEQVCMDIKSWEKMGYSDVLVSVNMSRDHLTDNSFVQKLYEICQRYQVSPSRIEIEITESAAYDSMDVLSKVFKELKSYGFRVSIDDFGTGFSSLNMLKNLSADVLKLDREFITGTDNEKRANDIVTCVIMLARALGMETICEGIETKEQADKLRRLGCDMAQGYYYAKPMTTEAFETLIKNGSPTKPVELDPEKNKKEA